MTLADTPLLQRSNPPTHQPEQTAHNPLTHQPEQTAHGAPAFSFLSVSRQFGHPPLHGALLLDGLLLCSRWRSWLGGLPGAPGHHVQVTQGVDHQQEGHGGHGDEVQEAVQDTCELLGRGCRERERGGV